MYARDGYPVETSWSNSSAPWSSPSSSSASSYPPVVYDVDDEYTRRRTRRGTRSRRSLGKSKREEEEEEEEKDKTEEEGGKKKNQVSNVSHLFFKEKEKSINRANHGHKDNDDDDVPTIGPDGVSGVSGRPTVFAGNDEPSIRVDVNQLSAAGYWLSINLWIYISVVLVILVMTVFGYRWKGWIGACAANGLACYIALLALDIIVCRR